MVLDQIDLAPEHFIAREQSVSHPLYDIEAGVYFFAELPVHHNGGQKLLHEKFRTLNNRSSLTDDIFLFLVQFLLNLLGFCFLLSLI